MCSNLRIYIYIYPIFSVLVFSVAEFQRRRSNINNTCNNTTIATRTAYAAGSYRFRCKQNNFINACIYNYGQTLLNLSHYTTTYNNTGLHEMRNTLLMSMCSTNLFSTYQTFLWISLKCVDIRAT